MSNILGEIEEIIDTYTVSQILEAISTICHEKAEHIRLNWQDKELAQEWERTGKVINSIIVKMTV